MSNLFHSLKFKVFLSICVLVLLSMSVMSFINNEFLFSKLTEYASDTAISTSNETKKSIEYILDLIQNTSALLCGNKDIINGITDKTNPDEEYSITTILRNAASIQPQISGIYIVGANGKVFSSIPFKPENEILVKLDHMTSDRGHYSGLYRGNNRNRSIDVISYYNKIRRYGKEIGTLIIDIDYNNLKEAFTTNTIKSDEKVLVVDGRGSILFNFPNYVNLESVIADNPEILQRDNVQIENDVFGIESIIVSSLIQNANWHIVRVITKENVYKDTEALKSLSFSISIIFIVLALGISLFLSTRLTNPLKELRSKIKHVESGNLDINVKVNSHDEYGQLSQSFDNMVVKLKDYKEKEFDEQKKKSEMKFQILQNQINPHFLYNTLDSVKWLATIQNVSNISEMVTSLIHLLRYNLLDTDKLTTLSEEIEGVNNYIVIQKYRYGDLFTVTYNIPDILMHCKVLRFILQPIVENSIYHGFENLSKQGAITINACRIDQKLVIEVIDNGSGPGIDNIGENVVYKRSDSFNGIGLNNIQERIQLYFGSQYGLKLTAGENNKGTVVTITVPYLI